MRPCIGSWKCSGFSWSPIRSRARLFANSAPSTACSAWMLLGGWRSERPSSGYRWSSGIGGILFLAQTVAEAAHRASGAEHLGCQIGPGCTVFCQGSECLQHAASSFVELIETLIDWLLFRELRSFELYHRSHACLPHP